ncbi:DUF962 domain-containing protein [soil metagenome]
MNLVQLLQWQWKDYGHYHRNRSNLLMHIIAVPMFILGAILLMVGLYLQSKLILMPAIASLAISLIVQGRGHKLEAVPPAPFESPANAMSRLLLEQLVTFPRFVLSGGWARNLAASAMPAAQDDAVKN